ncbi:replication factor A protein 3 [Acrodontium crateriforme]|uniref:Replication factor A protein 3 n=1 Tax=Acrodontium crateriforme TaxID=150365 RepID=A0AAQ3M4Y9_9PEZI|nr:replication factor A protein 3 [Acrodontium crateriforme]
MAEVTPRITAPYLEQFSHNIVRITGKVRQLRGEQATIDAAGSITVHLTRDSHLQLNHAVELIGKVQQDLSVRVLTATDLGPEGSIDFAAIDAIVDATHRYHEIFYNKGEQ